MRSASTAESDHFRDGGTIRDAEALLGRIFLPDRYHFKGIFLPKKFQNPPFEYGIFLPKK